MSINCIFTCFDNYEVSSDYIDYIKSLTKDNIVVVTKETLQLIQYIQPQLTIVVTDKHEAFQKAIENEDKDYIIFETIEETKNMIKKYISSKGFKVFIIGSDLNTHFTNTYHSMTLTLIDKIHVHDGGGVPPMTPYQDTPPDNCFFKPPSFQYSLSSFTEKCVTTSCPTETLQEVPLYPNMKETVTKTYAYRTLTYHKTCNYIHDKYHCDSTYKSLAMKILNEGIEKSDRTGTGTVSSFGNMIEFDISQSVPVLTTKKIFWKSVIKELLWFLSGDTDSKNLSKQGVKIWEGNSSHEAQQKLGLGHLEQGDCGANYSFQWRHFGAEYKTCDDDYTDKGVDQIAYIENLLKTDKHSRRIFLTGWNPNDLHKTVLPPCHVSYQFYVDNNDGLSCHMYQRSQDVGLGAPFNIFSASVLTYILAMRCNLKPKRLVISIGDAHIYTDHNELIKKQLKRTSYAMPRLVLNQSIKTNDWKDMSIDDFNLIGYFTNPAIKAHMSV